MNDNELDDLFRSNADYLADQPSRGFDKDAFWQQLQTVVPKKNDRRKKTLVWTWAAAVVLLTGTLGGSWWLKQQTGGIETSAQGTPSPIKAIPRSVETPAFEEIAQGAPSPTLSVPDVRIPSPIPDPDKGKQTSQMREQPSRQVPLQSALPEKETATVAIQENSLPENAVEATAPLPKPVIPLTPKVPAYRVVHINEIRERKQQQAKARSRLAFRIGVPSGTRITTQPDYEAPLSISIQN